jgi:heme-degrading monooxygenase HmoA
MHAHNVYFSLHDRSSAAIEKFISDSKLYLAVITGIRSFACGVLEMELDREVNDRDFDISLHVVFESKEAHDAYQNAPSHNEFVARNKENFAAVRVFDSAVKYQFSLA